MLKKVKVINKIPAQFLKQAAGFSIVGVLVTIFSFCLLYLFINIFNVNVYISYTSAYIISIGVSYFLNGKLVFKATLNVKTYVLYYGIYISGMGLGLLAIALTKYLFDFGDFLNSICATPFTMVWNFLLIRYVFNKYTKTNCTEKFVCPNDI